MSFDDVIRSIDKNVAQKDADHQRVLDQKKQFMNKIVKEGDLVLDKRRKNADQIKWNAISKKVIELDAQGVSHTEIANRMRYDTGQFITQYDVSAFLYRRNKE